MRAAAIRCRGRRVLKSDLPPGLLDDPLGHADFPTLAELERRHVAEAMRRTNGHKGRAAELLGIHRNTLAAKLGREGGEGAGPR
jgi:transcriptional regulator of acetoin/glycerol metabolism